jgi:S-disulfanyl-L-cysteine oxidoreductase SoxD
MSMRKICLAACAVALAVVPFTAAAQLGNQQHFGFGTPIKPDELSEYFGIPPSGQGLPLGSGIAAQGAEVYAQSCVACHGEHLEGVPQPGLGGDKLIGGRGSLVSKTPAKTVESYWPYATTLFDYVKRAMPFNAPGSLTNDEVYSVVAYILSEAKVIKPSETMNSETLPKVRMPNRDGFVPDARPEVQLYR